MTVRILPLVKTGLLVVLVGVSLVLSEELWTGGWSGAGEVSSYTTEPALPQASAPSETAATAPYRVVVTDGNPSVSAIFVRGTMDYNNWLTHLRQLHIFSLHKVQDLKLNSFVRSAEFDFGVTMDYTELLQYVPGFQPSVLPKQGQTVYLYQTQSAGPVYLALVSDTATYVAQTDLDVSKFTAMFQHAILLDPWELWNQQAGSYVPKYGFDMFNMTVVLDGRSVVPLAHSFFVNPQALTSVQESPHLLLWTDGSRAVWWDQQQRTLTYADPNLAPPLDVQVMPVADVLAYVRSHGGAPVGSMLAQSTSSTNSDTDWTLRPYVSGFPILESNLSIHIQTIGTHVAKYQFPVDTFHVTQRKLVHIMGSAELTKILHHLMPSTSTAALSVQLGYVLQPVDSHTANLVPAYVVSQSGMALWEIDAVTGKVLKGMKVS